MPELAEVEYYRRQWDCGVGARIVAVQLHAQKRVFRGCDTREIRWRLTGSRLIQSSARGKQMLFHFSGRSFVGIHLGMSGTLRVEPAGFRAGKHDHFVLQQSKWALVFGDPRMFGRVRFHHGETEPPWWTRGLPEIGSNMFTAGFVADFLQRHRRAPIKAVLLLQSGFPGVGNWMADEILWRAQIAPRTPAGRLGLEQQSALRRSTRFVCREALRIVAPDFSDPPRSWLIHQRWKPGGVCPRHRVPLERDTVGGRTTAWCSRCQPANPQRS